MLCTDSSGQCRAGAKLNLSQVLASGLRIKVVSVGARTFQKNTVERLPQAGPCRDRALEHGQWTSRCEKGNARKRPAGGQACRREPSFCLTATLNFHFYFYFILSLQCHPFFVDTVLFAVGRVWFLVFSTFVAVCV